MMAATIEAPTLVALAATANREHGLVHRAEQAALTHSISAGEALLEARKLCEHGEWHAWLAENFIGSKATASAYMRIAHYKDSVAGCDGFGAARALLRGLPAVTYGGPPGHGDATREQAQALVSDGASYAETARMLGVQQSTVKRWTDTDYEQRRKDRARQLEHERYHERRRQREKTEQRRLKRLAKAKGGAIAEAYSLAERMQDALGLAERQASAPEAKAALAEAGTHYRRMRDDIVRALGAS